MKHAVKGLNGTPNITKIGQRRRMGSQVQYEHEILSELVQLSREKTWLNKEKENWQERISQINERLLDIEKLEETLIQKQMAMKQEQTYLNAGKDSQISEAREMVIKY